MIASKKGFTLTELLIVVVIMGVLASVAVPLYTRTMKRSRASDALHVLDVASEKQEAYYISNKNYAQSFSDLSVPVKGLDGNKTVSQSGVKVGPFTYQMSDSCFSAAYQSSQSDSYVIYRNYETQQVGCVGNGCSTLSGIIDNVSSVSCPPVTINSTTDNGGSGNDPCVTNPSSCCPEGTTWNGTKCAYPSCPSAKVYDVTTKSCVCANVCTNGGTQNASDCSCSCPGSCIGGQVMDSACNCSCPSSKPNWDSSSASCVPSCSSPKTRWDGSQCACPLDKPLFDGTNCISCPVGKTWNGTTCGCSSDTPYEWGGKCMACSQSDYNSKKAACTSTQYGPAGTWTDAMCSCSCPDNSAYTGGHCSCPSATPYFYSGNCNKCKSTDIVSNGVCCPQGKVSLDGSSCVYAYKPKRISAGVLVDCHNIYSYLNKSTCAKTSPYAYFDGGHLPTVSSGDGCTVHHAYYNSGNWWEGGTLLGRGIGACSGAADQSVCNSFCKDASCDYKCVISQSAGTTCGVYTCSNGPHCDNSSGSAVVLTCVRA